jgi:F-type H+-transporting ATPase subunit a
MEKSKRKRSVFILLCLMVVLLIGVICTGSPGGERETISEVMRDAVLHESNRVALFGITVNPGLISAFSVTGIFLVFALVVRLFVIPKFTYVPGKFQLVLEEVVNLFDNLAKGSSPHRNKFLSVYLFVAGCYIFVGTLFELFGFQVITTKGTSISLPAPLADINGAIALGCLSYVIILSGGILGNGMGGVGSTLKEFSLPISMSFRLFGALLSGALVTELVYYYIQLSFVLPVIVGVLFTLLHALVQSYVLTMLTALFYGEVSEPSEKKKKTKAHTQTYAEV